MSLFPNPPDYFYEPTDYKGYQYNYIISLQEELIKLSSISFQNHVKDKDILTPPGSPAVNDRYLINGTGTGAWSGQDFNIAEYNGTSWEFITKTEGMMVWVDDENLVYVYNGSSWATLVSYIGTITDSDAIHKTTTSEITGLTEKTNPEHDDVFLMESIDDSGAKRKITHQNIIRAHQSKNPITFRENFSSYTDSDYLPIGRDIYSAQPLNTSTRTVTKQTQGGLPCMKFINPAGGVSGFNWFPNFALSTQTVLQIKMKYYITSGTHNYYHYFKKYSGGGVFNDGNNNFYTSGTEWRHWAQTGGGSGGGTYDVIGSYTASQWNSIWVQYKNRAGSRQQVRYSLNEGSSWTSVFTCRTDVWNVDDTIFYFAGWSFIESASLTTYFTDFEVSILPYNTF